VATRAVARIAAMNTLRDGSYDAFILDAEQRGDATVLECTITSGDSKGDVVSVVTSSFVTRDPLLLVGLPCTLIVRGNEIRVVQ